jgi:alpha-tubulin suppressor-like RCC1 family protein
MLHSSLTKRTLRATTVSAMCATLLTTAVMAASPKLQTIDVTPGAKTISVGQTQSFTATGTFSDGSRQVLTAAMSDVTGGHWSTCALLTSRGVECWGRNDSGQLGDGKSGDSNNLLVPGPPVKGISTATAVTFGGSNACALLAGGTVRCWGSNYHGALGNGTTVGISSTPVSVKGITTATAVGAGWQHACALLASGEVRCWGYNKYGQLGSGSYADSSVPVPVAGISTAKALGLGNHHGCAVLDSGVVQCWGMNNDGQLGNGIAGNSDRPVTVAGITNATAVAAGAYNSCALLADGAVRCWGSGQGGELGNGSFANSYTPVPVTGISTAVAITGGGNADIGWQGHYCVILRNGNVQCWGWNIWGQLGNGTTANSNVPVTVPGIVSPTKLAAGAGHTCALFSGGVMKCWGRDNCGQLGNGTWTASDVPTPVPAKVVGTPGVLWKSSNTAKATITDHGLATGRAAGNTTITATTAGSINDNAVLTVK